MEAKLRVGIAGYGMMGRAHCYGYRVAPMLRRLPVTAVVTVMSGRDPAASADQGPVGGGAGVGVGWGWAGCGREVRRLPRTELHQRGADVAGRATDRPRSRVSWPRTRIGRLFPWLGPGMRWPPVTGRCGRGWCPGFGRS